MNEGFACMEVYHYSEDPTISEFVPRPSRLGKPLVWAIDAEHAPLYELPRDCPRVCYWPLPSSSDEDLDRWWSHVAGRKVIAIEAAWLERVQGTLLYRYVFEVGQGFEPLHDHGVHACAQPVQPLAVEPMGDLLACQMLGGVELRICQSLVPLGRAIIKSSLHYSLIRMRNATGW
jgi:hypothetical protein